MGLRVAYQSHAKPDQKPVVFFNASTRLNRTSLNAAFSALTAWSMQLSGVPIVHFACSAGMSRCVLGTNRENPAVQPPCRVCINQSKRLLFSAPVIWFTYVADSRLAQTLQDKTLEQLTEFTFELPFSGKPDFLIPLGSLVLPALRWVLRRHHLIDDAPTRQLYRDYILSAYNIAREFLKFLDEVDPQAIILFNGQFFPEATVRWLAIQRGIRVVTHEVGLRPFSAFFTTGEATAYPLEIPEEFKLTKEQNARLDAYLSQRFQGQFSMAGVRFWPEMNGLDEQFLQHAYRFSQIVPVFTNVIFDTSQPHSNVIFPHMFAWLDLVLEVALSHPETLFVIRAHPDEVRPGKESQESVRQWVDKMRVREVSNILFVDSRQPLSSYELIQRSKFVMIYNSTIGLEASIMGAAVLCAGRARFTQLPTVFFPTSPENFRQKAEEFLACETITTPPEFQHNARLFLYYQLFYSSLAFQDYLEEDGVWPGFVRLKPFSWRQLLPENSPVMQTIRGGIIEGNEFLLESSL
jgi:hypothetical protein